MVAIPGALTWLAYRTDVCKLRSPRDNRNRSKVVLTVCRASTSFAASERATRSPSGRERIGHDMNQWSAICGDGENALGCSLSGIVIGWKRKPQFYPFSGAPRSWAMYLTTSIYRIDFLLFLSCCVLVSRHYILIIWYVVVILGSI